MYNLAMTVLFIKTNIVAEHARASHESLWSNVIEDIPDTILLETINLYYMGSTWSVVLDGLVGKAIA